MDSIITQYPNLKFAKSSGFLWSPRRQTVYYDAGRAQTQIGLLALLHEIGHAELGHIDYSTDVDLLHMELDAWAYARDHARALNVTIDEEHIDHCLESYRIWLYKRSRCPQCEFHGVQTDSTAYRCFMCRHTWQVARNLTLQPNRRHCISAANHV